MAVVVTVAGLLAMHALSLHGTGTDGERGTLSLPAAHVEHMHGLDADLGAGEPTGHTGGYGHTTMMLCAAFLLAAGTLLLTGRSRSIPHWWRAAARARSRATGFLPLVTHPATGPPPVWAYSVIRC